MISTFDIDPYPGKPRILFVGLSNSTHTHAWMDLLKDAELNVRLFSIPYVYPPENWKTRVYITTTPDVPAGLDPTFRKSLYPTPEEVKSGIHPVAIEPKAASIDDWLAKVILEWRPDVIHTLGLEPASYFYARVRKQYHLEHYGKWLAQTRGGPDLALHRFLPKYVDQIKGILQGCDQFIADNTQNYQYAVELGLDPSKVCPLGVMPGTGGIDVDGLSSVWKGQQPSKRERIILYPKAYECPASKALPVLEALRLAWDKIKPCEVYLTAIIQDEIEYWVRTLPEEIQQSCHLLNRVPRAELMDLMLKSRVLLSPSLTDGIPNSLYEAMATGAFPIFSPLETITPVVQEEKNVLFARNLYPQEIADALVRAMQDDHLVDNAAVNNLALVRQIADRVVLGPEIIKNYETLSEKDVNYWRKTLMEQEDMIQVREKQIQQLEEDFTIRQKSLSQNELSLKQLETNLKQREQSINQKAVQLNEIEVNLNNLKNELNRRELAILQRELVQAEKEKMIEKLQEEIPRLKKEPQKQIGLPAGEANSASAVYLGEKSKKTVQKTKFARMISRIFGGE